MQEVDDEFYERADAHINLSNDQISESVGRGKVSASMMYATARFNSWISACGWDSGPELAEAKDDTIEYFVTQYRKMLDEHLEEYIHNFDAYMRPGEDAT